MNNIARRLACVALVAGLAACATAPAPSVTSAGAAPSTPKPLTAAVPPATVAKGEVTAKSVETTASVATPHTPASDAPSTSALPAMLPSGAAEGLVDRGFASWYGRKFHGRRTASGERYDMNAMTAAHKTLPFGTRVRVRSVATGKEVVVRINDRGPYRHQRIIDLSQAAIASLGLKNRGVTTVELWRE